MREGEIKKMRKTKKNNNNNFLGVPFGIVLDRGLRFILRWQIQSDTSAILDHKRVTIIISETWNMKTRIADTIII